jgi:hypothetical protein
MRTLSSAAPYLAELSTVRNIIVASEHRLFECELNKLHAKLPGYGIHSKASNDLSNDDHGMKPGHCGIFVAWKDKLNHIVKEVDVDSDRICAIQLVGIGQNKANMYVIGVYLPHQQCKIANFDDHLDVLEHLVEQCMCDGEVVILGDYNCHFGCDIGTRYWGSTSQNARQLYKMFQRKSLFLLDKDVNACSGPSYTFKVDGVGESYIDNIAVTYPLIKYIVKCQVLDDCIENTSDHLPMFVNINASGIPEVTKACSNSKIAWHKLTQNYIAVLYTAHLETAIDEFFPENCFNAPWYEQHTFENIDTQVNRLMQCMQKLPKSVFKKSLKPYWSKGLTKASKYQKQCWHVWKDAGKPRQPENAI